MSLAGKFDDNDDDEVFYDRTEMAALTGGGKKGKKGRRREEIVAERISFKYKRLRMYLNSLPSNSNILNRNQQNSLLS
jgi:hypothetical protein